MRKARFYEWLLGNPVALGIVIAIVVLIAVLWYLNERKEYEDSERDRRNY